jgi:exopolyphosphatase / guanosine-5'-triphosphate,3'-diphosphate pyrophosphatase
LSKRFAIVSIGTNSTRVLLADVAPENPRVELVRSIGTRIGEGLGERGHLGDEPMQRTLDAVAQLHRAVRGHYVRLFAVATSALRRADNGDEFAQRVQGVLGVPLRVLSGEEEAAASYRGARTAFGTLRDQRVGVVDVGGGSTEYAVGDSPSPESVVSCETGAVRLTEALPALAGREGAPTDATIAEARKIAAGALKPITERGEVERLAFVGGSATTTAAIVRGKATPIGAYRLTRADLRRTLERLLAMTLEERKGVVGMKAQRADILPGGIIVLDTVLDMLGQNEAIATTADLLLGILLQERDATGGRDVGYEGRGDTGTHRTSRGGGASPARTR